MLTESTHDLSNRDGALRIGVLSDTHGEIATDVKRQLTDCDVIVHAGDICGQHVLDELNDVAPDVFAVAGNNDPFFDYTSPRLPDVVHLIIPGGVITILHGHQFGVRSPSHDKMREAFALSRTVVYGHSHRQVHDRAAAPEVLNPGAAGKTRTNGGASCAVLIAGLEQPWHVSLFREH